MGPAAHAFLGIHPCTCLQVLPPVTPSHCLAIGSRFCLKWSDLHNLLLSSLREPHAHCGRRVCSRVPTPLVLQLLIFPLNPPSSGLAGEPQKASRSWHGSLSPCYATASQHTPCPRLVPPLLYAHGCCWLTPSWNESCAGPWPSATAHSCPLGMTVAEVCDFPPDTPPNWGSQISWKSRFLGRCWGRGKTPVSHLPPEANEATFHGLCLMVPC